jgi:hypothetical protein
MAKLTTWLVTLAVGTLVLAGLVDAVHRWASHPGKDQAGAALGQAASGTASTARATSTTATHVEPTAALHLPACRTAQLALDFHVENGLGDLALRRVVGRPCHHERAVIGFRARDAMGGVAVFGGADSATSPADFTRGFVQAINIPQMSCAPEDSVHVIATVGPYVARATLRGAQLACDHG